MGKNSRDSYTFWSALCRDCGICQFSHSSSGEDPLITKSYLDEQIAKLKREVGSGGSSGGIVTDGGSDHKLVVEQLQSGQSLIAAEGTEVIVRTGQVIGISSKDGNGIPNVTAGTDIKGTTIPHNNLLLFPRNDGRGVHVVKGPSHIMVRGSYEIR
ncbi:hypothetical protein [Caldalkalibacillus mannanilyticus]|uniref:hypothetical protein n=1 Tax=Caldalkalibacillus mannanilyticus TaxID=1418 RepID=UPI00046AF114|nr:hypothetical protein [Caldalkalibacillus mannanilyticus]